MQHSLLSIDELVRTGWDMTKANWRNTLRYTLTPLIISLGLNIVFTILPLIFKPLAQNPWYTVGSALPGGLISLWFMLRLMKFVLKRDQGQDPSPEATRISAKDILSLIWIFILVLVPTLLGSIFFLIPGIWLGNLFAFAFLVYLEDHQSGITALKTSKQLVQGRWWPTFWRRLVPGLLAIASVIAASLIFIFGALLGTAVVFAAGYGVHVLANNHIVTTILTVIGVTWVIAMLIVMVAFQFALSIGTSLFALFTQIRLFHTLKAAPVASTSDTHTAA